jgi:hypothetical protein
MRKRAVVISVVFFGGTVAATGVEVDTYWFEDNWKPHASSRSLAEQLPAARACGATGPTLILPAAISGQRGQCALAAHGLRTRW